MGKFDAEQFENDTIEIIKNNLSAKLYSINAEKNNLIPSYLNIGSSSDWDLIETTVKSIGENDPNKETHANSIYETAANGNHYFSTKNIPCDEKKNYEIAVYIKNNGRFRGRIRIETDQGFLQELAFNINGNDWEKLLFNVETQTGATTIKYQIYIYDDLGNQTHIGDPTKGLLIYAPSMQSISDRIFCDDIVDEAYLNTLSNKYLNYNPFIYYQIVEIKPVTVGASSMREIKMVVNVCISNPNESLDLRKKTFRYSRALQEIMETHFKLNSNSSNIDISEIPPIDLSLNENSPNYQIGGLLLTSKVV